MVGYIITLILTLGFTPLFELRYFSPGIVITLLNCHWKQFITQHFEDSNTTSRNDVKKKGDECNHDNSSSVMNTADRNYIILGFSLAIVSGCFGLGRLMYVYLYHTFVGSDGDVARFML